MLEPPAGCGRAGNYVFWELDRIAFPTSRRQCCERRGLTSQIEWSRVGGRERDVMALENVVLIPKSAILKMGTYELGGI